ncbi:MAG: hypothetical protein IT245_00080 [Bacteroidia bacterium]|nr:hypothetical protein [Bacteroidia bacterium]
MTNNLNSYLFAFACLFVFFSSCKKDENLTVETEDFKGVFVINEGGFNKANGSLGLYKPGTKTYFDAFKKANDRPLGDVVQSMALFNNKFYILVNNSNKIEVVNQSDLKSVTAISTNSPRYLLGIGNNRALLSNLYDNSVKIVDLNSNSISKSVNINHWSESMATINGFSYISTFDDKIMMIKNDSLILTDSIATPSGLSKVVSAGADNIGVLCVGKIDWNSGNVLENGQFLIINKDSNIIAKSAVLTTAGYGGSLVYDPVSANFYFSLGNGIIQRAGLDGVVSDFITLPSGMAVYGLNVDNAGNLYIADAGDYNSAGKIYVYNSSATKINEFTAGIVPNGVFINE